ncbi:MAG TPA: bifunctional homocysteine S-methyltransferase/methylenetetrahydrofolate reductase [Candidatus Bathyarchaeia archaeon]|nr:bifunctional homocysteine S-methyltransferase/methylenetetrahydrofolate reductase [Candidatus Bathyarchaeia archaeon]
MRRSFAEVLGSDKLVVCDGAMGTFLYSQGISVGSIISGLNLSKPQLVVDVHRAYLKAGAEIIETNTFDANCVKLSQASMEDRLYEINSKGARLAREAVGDGSAFVAGSVGPLGKPLAPVGSLKAKSARWMYREQVTALSEGGADLIIFETFPDLNELILAVEVAKRNTNLAIFGQLTFIDAESTPAGQSPVQSAIALEKAGCDVIGTNCGGGPSLALQVIREMKEATSLPLSAFANASLPEYRNHMYRYESEVSYFANAAKGIAAEGAKFIGGCCGTTPSHIQAISNGLSGIIVQKRIIKRGPEPKSVTAVERVADVRSPFAEKLSKKFVITVEIDPPRGKDFQEVIQQVKVLKDLGIDAINVADNPLAKAKMSSLIFAHLIRERVGIDTILHFTCRDKNVLGLQSDLYGAAALGLETLVVMRGDLSENGEYPWATNVFDVTTSGLIEIIKKMNMGSDLAGNQIGKATDFLVGVTVSPSADDIEGEIRVLRKKISRGADFVITQTVYDIEPVKRLVKLIGPYKIPILVGILPLVSKSQMEFLHNEVPGIRIPEKVREFMISLPEERVEEEGLKLSLSLIDGLRETVAGIYIVPPREHFGLITTLLKKTIC